MNERIRKLRRTLDLTQKEFGDRIGVKGNTIATYEGGRNEPIDSVISLICREFNVNEEWLRTGKGEMFAPAPSSALDALAQERGLTHREYIVLEKLLLLRPEVRADLIDCLMDIAAAINADEIQAFLAFLFVLHVSLRPECTRLFYSARRAEMCILTNNNLLYSVFPARCARNRSPHFSRTKVLPSKSISPSRFIRDSSRVMALRLDWR